MKKKPKKVSKKYQLTYEKISFVNFTGNCNRPLIDTENEFFNLNKTK